LQELAAYYRAYSRREELQLKLPRPYGDYLSWLQRQDSSSAEAFWRRTLAGFDTPTPLPDGKSHSSDEDSYERSDKTVGLPSSVTIALNRYARQQQVTLNPLLQAAWGLVLARHSGQAEVVFGATVAGRPAEIEGIGSMVGLFINTLPVRVTVRATVELGEWLRGLQQQQAEAQEYAHTPLTEIQGWSEVARGTP